ncbi:TetR/AcrR family transcriptional regulator [Novosphingobium beihaiensis]|uniref:TetR/AcrR family transcriptional regulator n=1 Tax=Novosphingobium beihaiensis TaxID=2930389 RepID=A0ABT0BM81_9SPHN|nr:TetR/AcrR family transcriptional regulator [Novosphingobium beihaiensis]MCJ2185819.1 TetR/AcrR family transcriptional regulator [Novosphingobium beihaiensis]
MTASPARRGRPRSFDRDEALRQAMHVFWQNGYDGTTMAQLTGAMGIESPSIYAAFGSKEGLFREAVKLYVASEAGPAWQALERIPDLKTAIGTMLSLSIEAFVATEPQRGCLVLLGADLPGGGNDRIRAFLRTERRGLREQLVKRLAQEPSAKSSDPAALAECILAFFSGLAIAAVDGTDKAALTRTAELFCDRMFAS